MLYIKSKNFQHKQKVLLPNSPDAEKETQFLTNSGRGQIVPVFMYKPSTTMKRRVTRALRGFFKRKIKQMS